MTMLVLSGDALIRGLDTSPLRCTCGKESHDFCSTCIARHLLESGVVRDVSWLADVWPDPFGEWSGEQTEAARAMRAVMLAALAERAPQEDR